MPSSRLGSTHGRTTSGVACHHHLWAAQTVKRRRAWHEITALGLHARSDDVGRGMTSPTLDSTHGQQRGACNDITALGQHTWLDDVGHDMTSSPLGSTDGRTASSVACHHRLWTAHTVERRRAWHAIIAFGQHKRLNDVGRGMLSSPFGSTNGRTRRAWHGITALGLHAPSDDFGYGMASPPL